VWDRIALGDPVHLVREEDNSHDARAIEILWRDAKLGYVPRAENTTLSQKTHDIHCTGSVKQGFSEDQFYSLLYSQSTCC